MKILLFIFLCIVLVVAVIGLLMLIGISKTKRYTKDMIYLEGFVIKSEGTKDNFDFILARFDEISQNNRDSWRTRVVWQRFKAKYQSFIDELVADKTGYDKFIHVQDNVKRVHE